MSEQYMVPELEELGSAEELTLAGSSGSALDADFGAGTSRGSLTFS
jgi:hypothetical protein